VSDELIRNYQHRSYLDRLQSLLSGKKYSSRLTKYKRETQSAVKSNGNRQRFNGGETSSSDSIKLLPFAPLKSDVLWLPLSQQDRNAISLTEEIEKFHSFVSVRTGTLCVSLTQL
jgi:hypothetical protein